MKNDAGWPAFFESDIQFLRPFSAADIVSLSAHIFLAPMPSSALPGDIEKHFDQSLIDPQQSSMGEQLKEAQYSTQLDSENSSQDLACDEPTKASNHEGNMVTRVLDRVTSRSSVGIGPPPDGGLRAWLCGE